MYGKPTSTRARPSQDYQSPNMFAQGDDFRPWQLAARVVVSPPVASTVRDLCQQLLEFRLPLSLLTTLIGTQVLEGQRRFFEALDGWRQHNPSLICSDDPHRMSSYWVMLCCIYQSLNDVGSETAQRRGVHEIVDLVFTLSLGSKFKTRFDERIHLCKVANPVSVTPKPIMTADTLVTTEHSAQSLHDIGVELVALQVTLSQDMLRQLEWGERRDEFSLIMFAGEFKTVTTSSNMSNLVMDLTTAQYHRRALKLKDRVVFGGTYSSGILEVYSSSWDENWLHIHLEHTFHVRLAIDLLEFFSFLCNLRNNLATWDDFASLNPASVAASVKDGSWRAQAPPPHQHSPSILPDRLQKPDSYHDSYEHRGNVEGVEDLDTDENTAWAKSFEKWESNKQDTLNREWDSYRLPPHSRDLTASSLKQMRDYDNDALQAKPPEVTTVGSWLSHIERPTSSSSSTP